MPKEEKEKLVSISPGLIPEVIAEFMKHVKEPFIGYDLDMHPLVAERMITANIETYNQRLNLVQKGKATQPTLDLVYRRRKKRALNKNSY